MNRMSRYTILVPVAIILAVTGCNSRQARAEKAVAAYRAAIGDCIKYNESYKTRPDVLAEKGFIGAIDQTINVLKKESPRIDNMANNFGEDNLLNRVETMASTLELFSDNIYGSLCPNPDFPDRTTAEKKMAKEVKEWTDGMSKVIQPHIAEIHKIASMKS